MSDTHAIETAAGPSLFETLGSLDREIARHRAAAETLKRQADALLERVRDHENVTSELTEARNKLSALNVKVQPQHSASTAPRKRVRRNSFAWRVRKHALELITNAGRPLGRAELLEGLISIGVKIESSRPSNAIGRIMWGASEFEYKNNGYWIVGRPLPEGSERTKRYKAPKSDD